jgi:hypothetical protein
VAGGGRLVAERLAGSGAQEMLATGCHQLLTIPLFLPGKAEQAGEEQTEIGKQQQEGKQEDDGNPAVPVCLPCLPSHLGTSFVPAMAVVFHCVPSRKRL